MTQKTIYTPKQVLDIFPDKDDLLYYLKMKFKNPSIELHVDANNKVIGFIAVDGDGNIFTTFNTPGKKEVYNENKTTETLELCKREWMSESKALLNERETSAYLKAGLVITSALAILFFLQNHFNRKTEPNPTIDTCYHDTIK